MDTNSESIDWYPHSVALNRGQSPRSLPSNPREESRNKVAVEQHASLLLNNGFQPHSDTDTHTTLHHPGWGQYAEIHKPTASYRMSKPTNR